jgi:protein SCO1/2
VNARRGGVAAALWLAAATSALAITPQAYREIGVTPPVNAAVPLALTVTDESGHRRSLRDLIGAPTVLVFADYTCRTLCGPVVAFVADALAKSGMAAEDHLKLIVVGLDPKDTAADAARMRSTHLDAHGPVAALSSFVTADQDTVAALTAAVGYRYLRDADDDQFVHPAAAFVLDDGGRVARVLTGLGIGGDDMRLALVEAGEGRIGTLRDRVRLLCSSFDPAHGAYNLAVSRVLAASALTTIAALGGIIGALILMGRRRPT